MTTKICADCHEQKPLNKFARSKFSEDKRFKRCKGCEEIRQENFTDYERARNKNLYYLYGIELEEFNEILETQGGVCKLCEAEPTPDRVFYVDHCHDSLKIRGIVCFDCNTGLARFKDSVEIMKRAIAYLESDGDRVIPKPIVWKN